MQPCDHMQPTIMTCFLLKRRSSNDKCTKHSKKPIGLQRQQQKKNIAMNIYFSQRYILKGRSRDEVIYIFYIPQF